MTFGDRNRANRLKKHDVVLFLTIALRELSRDVGSAASSGHGGQAAELSSRRQPQSRLCSCPEIQYSICRFCIDAATADTPKPHFQINDSILPNATAAIFFFLCYYSVRTHRQSSADSTHRRVGPPLSPLCPLRGFCGSFLRRHTLHSNDKRYEKIGSCSGKTIQCGVPGGARNVVFSQTFRR